MIDMSIIVWWFPILFMIHEMEEIILIKPWKEMNTKCKVSGRRIMPYEDFLSTESFSIAVLEEFMLIIGVTIHAWYFGTYYVCVGLFVTITVHHLLHIFMCIGYKGFVPGVISSIVILFSSIYLIQYVVKGLNMDIGSLMLWSVITFVVFVINLKMLHKLMPWFQKLLSDLTFGIK